MDEWDPITEGMRENVRWVEELRAAHERGLRNAQAEGEVEAFRRLASDAPDVDTMPLPLLPPSALDVRSEGEGVRAFPNRDNSRAPVLRLGDCLDVLRELPDCSIDAIVTDPPYGLAFMGKRWDYDVPSVEVWAECLRVLKPGGHLLAFAGTRTQHRMACRIEDAGFEIRDMIAWLYGSGFPKSLDVSKAMDKRRDDSEAIVRVTTFMADAAEAIGMSRADVDAAMGTSDMGGWWLSRLRHRCQCPKWEQWQQLKTLLRLTDEMDAEVWRLNGRKGMPGEAWGEREVLAERTMMQGGGSALQLRMGERREVQANVTAPATDAARQWAGWGTALKPALEPITVARKPLQGTVAANVQAHGTGALNIDGCRVGTESTRRHTSHTMRGGNFENHAPSERIECGSDSGRWPANVIHDGSEEVVALFPQTAGDGSAARFFYCAKASRKDRGEGNAHPTVKPTDLMRYLCRLVTPPGGVVLDPFMGSGSTGKAAALEGFGFVGIERDPEYFAIAAARIESASEAAKPEPVAQPELFP